MRVWLLALMLVACVPEPSDPVSFGQLCSPPSDECRNDAVIYRDSVGRNQLDFTVSNIGDNTAFVSLQAFRPGESDVPIVTSELELSQGETAGQRWTPQELGVFSPLQIQLDCAGCEAQADFVLTSVPLECISDDDCGSGWFCDTNSPGRCVECRSDSECSLDQRCDIARGRCDPPDGEGTCQHVGGIPLVLTLMLIWPFLRRRRPALVLSCALVLTLPGSSDAAAPVASLGIGVGPQIMTGELGDLTQMGWGLGVGQELRWRYAGMRTAVGATYFLTNQNAPPFSKGLQSYFFQIGPRAFIPVGPVEIPIGVDYSRLGLASNTLVQITGIESGYNGLNVTTGVRFRWSGLEVRGDLEWQPYLNFPGQFIGARLSIALVPR